jgi:hypothetical protein
MAKQLINNYRIDWTNDIIYVKGNYRPERFLLITDVDSNSIIYNFAGGATTGYTSWSFSEATEETSLYLAKDLSAMAITGSTKLQIFVEEDEQAIKMQDSLLDPVHKLRVSTPQNLIDTDFEYGIQSTKWETVELSNNIPSYYVSEADTGLTTLVSVATTAGSDFITVTSEDPHRLAIGSPIDVRGVSSQTAEGKYLISSTPSDYVFVYKCRANQSETKNINGSYTTITPGQFYAGSQIPFDTTVGISTDQATTSSITITTVDEHGFAVGSNFYLVNSVAPKFLEISNTTGSAPDGRPFVDSSDILPLNFKNTTALTETKAMKATYSTKIVAANVNTTTNTISWPGNILHQNDCLLYTPPAGDDAIGGLARFQVYYVATVGDNLQLSDSPGGSVIDLTTTGTYNFGRGQLSLCYRLMYGYKNSYSYQSYFYTQYFWNGNNYSGWDLASSTYYNSQYGQNYGMGNKRPTAIMPFSPGNYNVNPSILGFTYRTGTNGEMLMPETDKSPSDFNFIEDFNRYGRYERYAVNIDYWSFYQNQPLYGYGVNQYTDYYSSYYDYYQNTNRDLFIMLLEEESERDTFYYPSHNLLAGSSITFNLNSGSLPTYSNSQYQNIFYDPARSTLSTGTYTTDVVSTDRFRLLDGSGNSVRLLDASGSYQFTGSAVNTLANSFYLANHNLITNDSLTITAISGGVLPVVNSGALVPDSSAASDNVAIAYSVLSAYMDTYVDGNGTPLILDGFSSQQPIADGTSGGQANSYLQQYYQYSPNAYDYATGQSANNQNIDWDGVNVKDAMAGTILANKGYKIIGTKYTQNASVKHYSYLWFNSTTQAQHNFDLGSNLNWFNNSQPPTQLSYQARSHGGNWYTTGACIAQPGDGSSKKGFVNFTFALINTSLWDTTGYTSPYSFYSGAYCCQAYMYGSGKKYVKFSASFMLPAATTTWGQTQFYSLLDGMITDFIANFAKPALSSGNSVKARTINNNRFALKNSAGIAFDISSSGTPTISLELTSQAFGAADGAYSITSVPTEKSFVLKLPFKAKSRDLTFSASASVSYSLDLINLPLHNLANGTPLVYSSAGTTAIGALTSGSTYYALVKDDNWVGLSTSLTDLNNGVKIDISGSASGSQKLIASNVNGRINGKGTVTTTTGSYAVVGSVDTLFKRYFKIGDTITIKNKNAVAAQPGDLYDFQIASIADDNNLTVTTPISFASSATPYLISTLLYARPDGATFHRPFDGGVEIQAGSAPNSQIIRQTRKYFRYQSGKGIQTSLAINFNPPRLFETLQSSGTTVTGTNKYPHRIKVGDIINVENASEAAYNGVFTVVTTPDDFTFTYTAATTPNTTIPNGLIIWNVQSWNNSVLRAGMFDNQNGFFYEYDGQQLYTVRRSSTTQISGTAAAVFNSNKIIGTNTNFTGQLLVGDKIVLRGTTYKITKIKSKTELIVNPQYKGISADGIIITKTEEKRIPQSEWNLDKCDGTGPSGFNLDTTKIQMAYMDYSWYGAGKIRFGFKDRDGHIIYVNQIVHNNRLNEAYMRSGNLPARYEIENTALPTYVPTLFHWGTSVIMDGRYDDDGAYKFTASSKTLSFTNGQAATATTTGTSQVTVQYNPSKRTYDWYVQIPFGTGDASKFSAGTKLFGSGLSGEEVSYTEYGSSVFYVYIYIQSGWNYPFTYPTVSSGGTVNIGTATAGTSDVKLGVDLIPLISVRLAPSVDNGLTGNLGAREIINRMQLKLKEVGLILTHDCEVSLILNGDSSNAGFENVNKPSLSQLIIHNSGDAVVGGTKIFQFRAAGGSTEQTTNFSGGQAVSTSNKRLSNTTNFQLDELIDMGNSILGGDTTFPNGPDILTVAVSVIDTQGISAGSPFAAGARLTWTESQA